MWRPGFGEKLLVNRVGTILETFENENNTAKMDFNELPDGSIVYVNGKYIDHFFIQVYPKIINTFVLITGESTLSVPNQFNRRYLTSSISKVIHWFGQNGDLHYSNEKFTSIPIGINCFEHTNAIQTVGSIDSNMNTFVNLDPLDPLRKFPIMKDSKLLLLNFDYSTDPSRSRKKLWEWACIPFSEWSTFSTCFSKETGVNQYISNLSDIYQRNMKYKFWISPRGMGLDCHRT